MASIRTRTGRNGRESFTVLWRDQDGRQKGRSFPDRSDAEEFLTVLDSTPLGQQPVWRGDVAQIAAEAASSAGDDRRVRPRVAGR